MSTILAKCPHQSRTIGHLRGRTSSVFIEGMTEDLRSRLLAAIEASGKPLKRIAREAGVSHDALAKWRARDGASTSAENAEKLVAYFRLGSAGPSAKSGIEGREIEVGDVLVDRLKIEASAGNGLTVGGEEAIERLSFPPYYIRNTLNANPRDLAIISVNGNSMEKSLKHGDIVMVDQSKRNPVYDGMFVLRTDDVLRVKRFQRPLVRGVYTLVSDNPEYKEEVWPEDRVSIIGRVIWVGSKV